MKIFKISLILLLVLLIALPLFAKRGRTKKPTGGPQLAFSLFGGAENLNGEQYADPDSSMYLGFGVDFILPIYQNFAFKVGLVKFDKHDELNVYGFGTGVGGDIMYYFPLAMAFSPYGFGGFWYNGSSMTDYSTTNMKFRFGVGGEMRMAINLFAEAGLDYISASQEVGGVSSDFSYMPIFIYGGVRFPLFR